jgi:hypothetical protein
MTAMKTDYRSLYDKDYIGAWDLADTDKVITITKVIGGNLTGQGGRKTKKPVVYFQGSEKGFALNSTNGKTIAGLYGNHVEGWAGKKIALYKSTTRNPDGSGDVDCIRVRPKVPDGFAGGAEKLVTADQAQELEQLCTAKGVDAKEFLTAGEIGSFAELPVRSFENAKKWVNKRAAELAQSLKTE